MMRMLGSMTIAAIALGTAGLVAQTSTATSQRPAAAEALTVTGCIERADQISQTGALGTTVDSLTFVLIKTNASGSSAASSTKGTSGTSGAAPDTTLAGRLYRLDAKTATLNPHVGHKVELTGTLTEPGAAKPDPSDPLAGAPKMRVDAVKMLAQTCSR
jgi:hypothetical protein